MPFEAEKGFILGGERPITQCKFLRAWERINKTICLYGATPHILRHSFITAAVPYVDVKTLQSIAGHADISTTAMPTGRWIESWRRGKPFKGCMEGRLYQNYTTLKTCYPLPIKGLSDGKAALFYHFLYHFSLFR